LSHIDLDLRQYLLGLKKEELVSLLMEQLEEDDRLRRRLTTQAARSGGTAPELSVYRRALDEAVAADGFVSYRQAYDYSSGIEEVVSSIEELLGDGHAEAVLELAEYALQQVEDAIGHVDDSNGYMGGLLEQLQTLHLQACEMARPDPRMLAGKLFNREMTTDYDVFFGAVEIYADVLGEEGLAVYRRMAEVEWDKIQALGPGDKDTDSYGLRYKITSIMKQLARGVGDLDGLVAVMSRDLSSPYGFLKIAKACKEAGQPDLALEWAERGWNAFPPPRRDGRLRDFMLEASHEKGRHDAAMEMMWGEFCEQPGFEMYKLLKSSAQKAGRWPDWREKALVEIRRDIAADIAAHSAPSRRQAQYQWERRAQKDHSELVRIFLFEKEFETAWREAESGGCCGNLWLQLAEAREQIHPEDAVRIYRKHIDDLLRVADNRNYHEAVGFLQKTEKLLLRSGDREKFQSIIGDIRLNQKRKRNLMKLLDQKGW